MWANEPSVSIDLFLFSSAAHAVFGLLSPAGLSHRVQCQSFEWDASSDLVSADFGHATLGQALESIAEAMGWDVFVEPGLEARRVKTRFSRLPRGEALRRILEISITPCWAENLGHRAG